MQSGVYSLRLAIVPLFRHVPSIAGKNDNSIKWLTQSVQTTPALHGAFVL